MKKDSVIFFIHGYGSSSNTDKFTKIPFKNKLAIDLDYDDGLSNCIVKVNDELNNIKDNYNEIILVGHSMGGYIAHELSKLHNLNCVLIAPCLFPEDSSSNVLDFENNIMYNTKQLVSVIFENDDEHYDISKYHNFLESSPYNVKYFNGGHHRIMRTDVVTELIDDISKYDYKKPVAIQCELDDMGDSFLTDSCRNNSVITNVDNITVEFINGRLFVYNDDDTIFDNEMVSDNFKLKISLKSS